MFKNIMVAVDGTSTSQRGLKVAADLARDQQATLHVVHVVDEMIILPLEAPYVPPDYLESMVGALRETGQAILAKAESFARERGVDVRVGLVEARGGAVATKLLREATRRKADLVVLGTHGRRGVRRLLLGSDAETVLREARVPVLLVRAPERGRARPAGLIAKPVRRTTRRAAPAGKSPAGVATGSA